MFMETIFTTVPKTLAKTAAPRHIKGYLVGHLLVCGLPALWATVFTSTVSMSHLYAFIPGLLVMILSVRKYLKSLDVVCLLVASILSAGIGYLAVIAAKALWQVYLTL